VPSGWPFVLALLVGLVGLFAIVILLSLRMRRRRIADELQNIHADAVWNEFTRLSQAEDGSWDRRDLLYGIWEDFSPTSVGMIVRDDRDSPVARVAYTIAGADISVGENRYRVSVGNTRGSTQLVEDGGNGSEAAAICSFVRKGWFRDRAAEYSSPDIGVLRISLPWGSPFKAFTSTITKDEEPIGKMGAIGRPYFNNGRMLILPARLPLPIRLFVLTWGTGPEVRSN
jgi:hypothetical protein